MNQQTGDEKINKAIELCNDALAITRQLLALCSQLAMDDTLGQQVAVIQNLNATKEQLEAEIKPKLAGFFPAALSFKVAEFPTPSIAATGGNEHENLH